MEGENSGVVELSKGAINNSQINNPSKHDHINKVKSIERERERVLLSKSRSLPPLIVRSSTITAGTPIVLLPLLGHFIEHLVGKIKNRNRGPLIARVGGLGFGSLASKA